MKNVNKVFLGKLYSLELESRVDTNPESKLRMLDKLNLIKELAEELEVLNEEVERVIKEIQGNFNR